MINPNSILSMMPLAKKLFDNDIDLSETKNYNIIKPLISNSVMPGVEYTEDSIYKAMQSLTEENGYDEALSRIKESFSEIISGYIFNLKNYINPFSTLILDSVSNTLEGSKNPTEFIFNNLTIQWRPSYDPIFDNQYFPSEKPEQGDLDYNNFDFNSIQGTYQPIPDDKFIRDYIGDINPEINSFIKGTTTGIIELFNDIFVRTDNTKQINFNRYEGICPHKLMGLLIFVSKMEQEDDPISLVSNVPLEVYRNNVSMVKRLLSNLLYETKNFYEAKSAIPINVDINNVKLETKEGTPTLDGTAIVYLNRPLDELNIPDEFSLSEVICGYLYESLLLNTRSVPALKYEQSNKEKTTEYFRQYLDKYRELLLNVSTSLKENIVSIVNSNIEKKLVSFRTDYPEFEEVLDALPGDNLHYKLVDHLQEELEMLKRAISTVLSNDIEYAFDGNNSENIPKQIREAVLFSPLLKKMGVLLGMEKTIGLLTECENDKSDNVALTLVTAIIDLMIRKCLTPPTVLMR